VNVAELRGKVACLVSGWCSPHVASSGGGMKRNAGSDSDSLRPFALSNFLRSAHSVYSRCSVARRRAANLFLILQTNSFTSCLPHCLLFIESKTSLRKPFELGLVESVLRKGPFAEPLNTPCEKRKDCPGLALGSVRNKRRGTDQNYSSNL